MFKLGRAAKNTYTRELPPERSMCTVYSPLDVVVFFREGKERRISRTRLPAEPFACQTDRQRPCWPSSLLGLCSSQAFSYCPSNAWSPSQHWDGAKEMQSLCLPGEIFLMLEFCFICSLMTLCKMSCGYTALTLVMMLWSKLMVT